MPYNRHQYQTAHSNLLTQFVVSTSPIKVVSMEFTKNAGSAVGVVAATTGDGSTPLFFALLGGNLSPLNPTVAWDLGAECYFPDGLAFDMDVANTLVTVVFSRVI